MNVLADVQVAAIQHLERTKRGLSDGQIAQERPQRRLVGTRASAVGCLYFKTGTWGQADYRRWGIELSGGSIYRRYYEGTSSYSQSLMALEDNTWYEVVLVADAYDQFRVVVWKQSDPNLRAENTVTLAPASWGGKLWMYYLQMHTGTVDVESYVEYDYGAMGQRTYLDDAPGEARWKYDFRGRLAEESKMIGSAGGGYDTFVTKYGYNSADLLTSMTYPDSEVVNNTYNRQMLLKSVVGNYDYLYDTLYDAAGRARYQYLEWTGFSPQVVVENTYNPWNTQGGRLNTLKAGTGSTPDSLQKLVYNYDAVGNILNIYDYKAGSPQTQTFTYNNLDRLWTAQASGGTVAESNYGPETCSYDSAGNLASKPVMGTFTYDTTHKHAVDYTSAGWDYQYDANGNPSASSGQA